MSHFYTLMPSPVGTLKLIASDKGLAAVLWENEDPRRYRLPELLREGSHPILLETARQLSEYFAGKRRQFALPLDFVGDRKSVV